MNFFAWLESLLPDALPAAPGTFHTGANIDTRTPEEAAAQDVTAAEVIASAAAVNWVEMDPSKVRKFGDQDQHSKSDCVAESRRKIKRILYNVNKGIDIDFSSVDFYRKRSNYPGEGMIAADAIAIDSNLGMTLDALVPSDIVTTEAAANNIAPDKYNVDVAKIFAIQNTEVVFTPGDMETIAGAIQKSRKGVMVWFYATVAEWSVLIPQIRTNLTGPGDPNAVVVHSVVAIEPALYNGVKGFWIDDSAQFGGFSRRFINETFFRARNWYASYPIAFKFEPVPTVQKPSYDGSTKSLQDCLKFEGVFPTNVDSTGVYGPVTTQAVKDFQKKYSLEQVGTVGPLTTAKLKTLYP